MSSCDDPGDAMTSGDVRSPNGRPRWEWRSFDYRPRLWQEALGPGLQLTVDSLTSESYLLAPGVPANVKIRRDRLEVKTLLRTDSAGLQQWWPDLKATFPLDAGNLAALLRLLQCPATEDLPTLATPDALFEFLGRRIPGLRVIPVRKWRRSGTLEGCRVERATVLVSGTVLESLAFEHEDAAVLRQVLQSRGLDQLPNTSYPVALGRVPGGEIVSPGSA